MLDCPWKTIPKWPLTLWIPYTVLQNMKMSFSISYDVYIDLTIGLVLKNYPKMTLDTLKSVHWIKSWENVFIFVQWPHHRNGLEKLPQNDSPLVKIHPLDQKLWRCIFSWCVQWPHHCIGLEKLSKNYPWHLGIHSLDQKLWKCLFPCHSNITIALAGISV